MSKNLKYISDIFNFFKLHPIINLQHDRQLVPFVVHEFHSKMILVCRLRKTLLNFPLFSKGQRKIFKKRIKRYLIAVHKNTFFLLLINNELQQCGTDD